MSQPEYATTKIVCNEVYNVLCTYLKGSSEKNELYMARHMAFFQEQVPKQMLMKSYCLTFDWLIAWGRPGRRARLYGVDA